MRIMTGGKPGPEIPPDFIGLSYEKAALDLPLFDANDTALVRLFRRLGPGVLRVGGNSVDRTLWDPEGSGLRKGLVAPADVSRLARFLEAADWRIIYGLNMGTSSPQAMADEASAARAAFGNRLIAFEIGNEPDLYHANGLRAPDYTYGDFLKEWENDARVISSAAPDASFTGPATASNLDGYTIPFSKDARGILSLLTHHYYRANGKLPTSTVGLMLSPDAPAVRAAGSLGGCRAIAEHPARVQARGSQLVLQRGRRARQRFVRIGSLDDRLPLPVRRGRGLRGEPPRRRRKPRVHAHRGQRPGRAGGAA